MGLSRVRPSCPVFALVRRRVLLDLSLVIMLCLRLF